MPGPNAPLTFAIELYFGDLPMTFSPLLSLLTLPIVGACSMFGSSSPAFLDQQGKILGGSIASVERVKLGGVDQWMIVRGRDATNPVLLYLHGGPGAPMAPLTRRFIPELEEDFVVVHWEQRGAGKSYSSPIETITIDQLVSDTLELSQKLRERFGQEKIFLLGHSWGSFLGINVVKANPELFHAYIGVGQVVDRLEGEKLSYDYALRKAQEANDQNASNALTALGAPPYPQQSYVSSLSTQRQVLRRYGGSIYDPNLAQEIYKLGNILGYDEYTLLDRVRWVTGQIRAERTLGRAMYDVNFLSDASKLDLPVFFLQGAHDWQTPTPLVKEYYASLSAPDKQMHIFEHSANAPIFEEPQHFTRVMRAHLLPLASS